MDKNLIPPFASIVEQVENMIISASGWRKVFTPSGDEQDDDSKLELSDLYLVALITHAYVLALKPKTVIVATDSRPTRDAIAEIVLKILVANNIEVIYLGISAAPEIFAYNKELTSSHFFYITASHNPIGHNGFKFGSGGQVFPSQINDKIVTVFNSLLKESSTLNLLSSLLNQNNDTKIEQILKESGEHKTRALLSYEKLTDIIAQGVGKVNLGVVCDMNGSARTLSIDEKYLNKLGIKTAFINNEAGQIVHGIVPEEQNLTACKNHLFEVHQKENSFVLGYMCDNDGDRGNIVYFDEGDNQVKILEAQNLFALIALIEMTLKKEEGKKNGLVVNCPTSLAVDTLAAKLDFDLFRVEVGEANVVQKAIIERQNGYNIPLLGEGSNGGNITYPSSVRDPLNTLIALIKLLNKENFKKITQLDEKPTIAKALSILPKRVVTGSYSKEGVLKVKTKDQRILKKEYEKLFLESWHQRKEYLEKQFNICIYKVEQSEGTTLKVGLGEKYRSGKMTGGLKIIFYDCDNNATDFVWMRGSQTEPVFRIMADALGSDKNRHDYLLNWQRELVEKADQLSSI